MTWEEFEKQEFRMTSHCSMAAEHTATYVSKNGRLGYCVHTPVLDDIGGIQRYGKSRLHYRIDGKVYKSKKKFIEALADYRENVKPLYK